MTPSQRLLFMDLLRHKNKTPYIFILLILITITLTIWTRNNYFAFLWGASLIAFFFYMVTQNIKDRATFFKADVLEDPNLLPTIEEKMRQHPDYFGL